MDIKIGLLVKNRLTLQDLVSHSQQVKRKDRRANRHSQLLDGGAVPGAAVGGLTKANHEKVEVCWFVCVCACVFMAWFGMLSGEEKEREKVRWRKGAGYKEGTWGAD